MYESGHDNRGDKWRRIVERVFGDAENPLGWALPLGTLAGIRVRAHLLFVVYVIAQMLWAIPKDTIGPAYQALFLTALFVLVLLHEFGHCFACRWVKGEANDILLWPLGGLASCAPPRTWRANFITTAGGPMVNVVLFPIFALALWATGHAGTIIFNPLSPTVALAQFESYALAALWIGHAVNLLLLMFNVLCPMFPLDGGRLVQALIWAKTGSERRSMEISVVMGFVVAGILGVFALVSEQTLLLGVAVFGGLICYDERRKLRAEEDLTGVEYAMALSRAEVKEAEKEREKQHKAELSEAARAAEEDRVLAKIAAEGMGSLTKGERKVLEEGTKRRRG